MALPDITTKVVGSNTYNERKITASDVNEIIGALISGTRDIKPEDILAEGVYVKLNGQDVGIRFNTTSGKMQFSNDGSTWNDIAASDVSFTVTAGENLAIRDAVYIDTADGKAYKCDADVSTKRGFIGFVSEAITLNNTGKCVGYGGILGGFSSITVGGKYYLSSTAGAITASPSAYYFVALGVSTTSVFITPIFTGHTHDGTDSSSTIYGEDFSIWKAMMEKSCVAAMKTAIHVNQNSPHSAGVAYTLGNSFMYGADMCIETFPFDNAETKTGLTYENDPAIYWDDENSSLQYISNKKQLFTHIGPNTITKGVPFVDYSVFNLLDNCGDSSVSASWTTTGGPTEDTDTLNLGNNCTAYWNATNYYQTYKTVIFRIDAASGATARISVSDGTTHTQIAQGATTVPGWWMLKFNGTDNTVRVRSPDSNGDDETEVSLAGLTSNWYIRFSTGGGDLLNLSFLADDSNTSQVSTVILDYAVDGSTTYQTITNGQLTTFTATGTDIKVRVTVTRDSTELFMLRGWGIIRIS